MARYSAENNGDGFIVTRDGKVLGNHQGIHGYTVGQRRGLGIPDATPYYVLALDPVKNEVVVGKKEELWEKQLTVNEVNWVAGLEPGLPGDFLTKIRYRHVGASAQVGLQEKEIYTVRFAEPQLAVTPGQFAVFYNDDEVIGGGKIL